MLDKLAKADTCPSEKLTVALVQAACEDVHRIQPEEEIVEEQERQEERDWRAERQKVMVGRNVRVAA